MFFSQTYILLSFMSFIMLFKDDDGFCINFEETTKDFVDISFFSHGFTNKTKLYVLNLQNVYWQIMIYRYSKTYWQILFDSFSFIDKIWSQS